MDLERIEAAPGIFVSGVQLAEGSPACLSAGMLIQLEREHAAVNSLIPYILCRGTNIYDTPEKLGDRLSQLGSMTLEPMVRCIGEIQCIGVRAAYTPEISAGKDLLLRDAASLLCSVLTSPATKGGLLLPENVDTVKQQMEEDDEDEPTIMNYAFSRCIEEMCCYEDYPAQLPGMSDAGSYTYKKISKRYKTMLQTLPIEFIYMGPAPVKAVATAVRHALSAIPRSDINYDIGTDIRMNAVENEVRRVSEDGFTEEGFSVYGYRIGDIMEDQPAAALAVLSGYIRSAVSSVLGSEAEVLCDGHKGILLVGAPVTSAALEAALSGILSVADESVPDAGAVSAAAASAADELRAAAADVCRLEDYTLARIIDGPDCAPEELAELAAGISADELAALIGSLDADICFELKPASAE